MVRIAAAILGLLLWTTAAEAGTVKVGVLKFGTVNWEMDVIRTHGLDREAGVAVELLELANGDAIAVALQAGEVDIIVTDWLWVTRQRAEGAGFTFVPFSTSVGALVVAADSPIADLADLAGKRLGIAGGPVDKNWLVLQAAARRDHDLDLDAAVDKVFGAPPLLNEQLLSGDLDAVITNWNFVAQLEAQGLKKLIGVEEATRELGVATRVPLLGYVFDEVWAAAHKADVLGFVAASRKAKALLAAGDAEWERLRPLMKAKDDATFEALRDGFRRGIPTTWGDAERDDAARLFALMAEIGGEDLVGAAKELVPGTFWADVSY